MDNRCYYACSVIADSAERFFLWYCGTTDGVLLDGDRIVTFPSRDALEKFCARTNLALSNESTTKYDLDKIDSWIHATEHEYFDIHTLLITWNMMDDFFHSLVGHGAISDEDLDLHEKLSLSDFAVSLPGVMVDENYDPNWTSSDRSRIAKLLDETTAKFKAAL